MIIPKNKAPDFSLMIVPIQSQEIAFHEAFYSINGLALIKHAIDRMNE